MIKLKKPTLIKREEEVKEQPKKKKDTQSKGKLPPDVYHDEFEPLEIEIDDTRKFIFSVKRGGDYGLPMCDIRQFQTTELYTGFTKKGITFPTDLLPDIMEMLQDLYNKCEEKDLFN